MATLRDIIEYSKKNPDTDYARQAFENIRSGKWDDKAKTEGLDLSFAGRPNFSQQSPEVVSTDKMTLRQKLSEGFGDIKETGVALADTAKRTVAGVKEIATDQDFNPVQKTAGILGKLAGGTSSAIGDVAIGAGKVAIAQEAEDKLKGITQKIAQGVAETEVAKDLIEWYGGLDKDSKLAVDALGGMASLIADVATFKVGTVGVQASKPVLEKTAQIVGKATTETIDTATDIAKGTVKAVTPDTRGMSQWLIDSTNKINPSKRIEFKNMTGKGEGEWLFERGIIGSREETVTALAENFVQLRKSVDEALDAIPGTYRDDRITAVADEALDIARNSESPELARIADFAERARGTGLTTREINELKRFYERNVKMGYRKDPTKTSELTQRATNRDSALREYLFEIADKNGFTNLREINKEIQASKFLADEIAGKLEGMGSNNMFGLTDAIVFTPALLDPKAIAGLIGKKMLSAEGTKAFFARLLAGFPERKPLPKPDLDAITKRAQEVLQRAEDLRIETEKAGILADELQRAGFTMSEGDRAFITDIPVPITRQEQALIRSAENRATQEQVVQYILEQRANGNVIGEGFIMRPAEPKYLELPERATPIPAKAPETPKPGEPQSFNQGAIPETTSAGKTDAGAKPRGIDTTGTPQEVASRMVTMARQVEPDFTSSVRELGSELGYDVRVGGVKSDVQRIVDKALNEKGGDFNQVEDMVRSAVLIKDKRQVDGLIAEIQDRFKVVGVKDGLNAKGYQKTIVNVELPNGLRGEIQITTPEMWSAKMDLGGDKLYYTARNPRTNTATQKVLNKRMGNLYNFVPEEGYAKSLLNRMNSGGATYDVYRGVDYAGTPNISVTPFPERTMKIQGMATMKQLVQFLEKNRDLIVGEKFKVGGWYNADDGFTYWDIAVPVPKARSAEALELGRSANQIANFDLETFSIIDTGGSGTADKVTLSFEERLRRARELTRVDKTLQ